MLLQVLLQPFLLLRTGSAAAYSRRITVGVERHYMPSSQVIAVISLATWSCLFAPICEIRQPSRRSVFVISRRWPRTIFEFSPRPVVTLAEFFRRAAVVGKIARRKH